MKPRVDTLRKDFWWTSRSDTREVPQMSNGPFESRTDAERDARELGWRYVSYDSVLTDESTQTSDSVRIQVYRVNGRMVREYRRTPNLAGEPGPLTFEFVNATEVAWPKCKRKARTRYLLSDWQAARIEAAWQTAWTN